MKLVLWIPTLVSIVVVTVKSVEALKRPNPRRHLRRMFIYTASAYLLYLALLPTIFGLSNFIAGSGWVSTHTLEIHLAVIAPFLSLFLLVWRRLREKGGRVGPGTIEKLKESIKIASRTSKQAAENYEKANKRIDGVEKEFQRVVEEIMNRLEEVSGGGGTKAVVKNSSNGGSKSVGRDNRDKSGSGAPELKEGTDGGKDWKELAEEYNWKELVGEFKERKRKGQPTKKLAGILRALKGRGCKFGRNEQQGTAYLQVRKYGNNNRETKGAGRIDDDMKKALDMAEIRV